MAWKARPPLPLLFDYFFQAIRHRQQSGKMTHPSSKQKKIARNLQKSENQKNWFIFPFVYRDLSYFQFPVNFVSLKLDLFFNFFVQFSIRNSCYFNMFSMFFGVVQKLKWKGTNSKNHIEILWKQNTKFFNISAKKLNGNWKRMIKMFKFIVLAFSIG